MSDAAPGRHELYEACVQSPEHAVPLLVAIHGRGPRVLGEDFAGTAAMSRRWVELAPEGRAVAVDRDAAALAHHPTHPAISKVVGDVLECREPCDVLFVGNFSIGYWHTRADLVRYLGHARHRLNPHGVFVCDTYGGESAFALGEMHRDHWLTDGAYRGWRVRYTWEQREADPLTGLVTDVLHFRIISPKGVVEAEHADAFVYRWRLWSVPELRDALTEAGFAAVEVYSKLPEAIDEQGQAYASPITDPCELDESFIVCVVGRAAGRAGTPPR